MGKQEGSFDVGYMLEEVEKERKGRKKSRNLQFWSICSSGHDPARAYSSLEGFAQADITLLERTPSLEPLLERT